MKGTLLLFLLTKTDMAVFHIIVIIDSSLCSRHRRHHAVIEKEMREKKITVTFDKDVHTVDE